MRGTSELLLKDCLCDVLLDPALVDNVHELLKQKFVLIVQVVPDDPQQESLEVSDRLFAAVVPVSGDHDFVLRLWPGLELSVLYMVEIQVGQLEETAIHGLRTFHRFVF